ncbi:MAG: ribbon-helix-helix protein, CopG family [Actinobacteria bacterium]|nr:ribbon-helix-helix protein, CopG family [Cyanobacteriota bacterium]MCL5771124.1 ribbon-helix-helix protein, CopG family [Actinomycetota bacterium]
MKSKYVRINLTIPEENLKQIDEFCAEENISRSEFVREASSSFIAFKTEEKDKEKIRENRLKAMQMMEEFRKKSSFTGGTEIIRKFRDERNK